MNKEYTYFLRSGGCLDLLMVKNGRKRCEEIFTEQRSER